MARKPKRDLTVEEQLARGPLDLPFLMLTMLLLGVGLIMMFSASFATAYYNDGDPLVYIKNQAVYAAAGVVVMFLVSKINYQTFRLLSVPGIVAAILLLVLALSPLGVELNEVKRWVRIGPIQFQPSEVAKVAVILFFATRLSKRDTEKKKKWSRRTLTGRTLERLDRIGFLELVPYGAILMVIALLMLMEPHMSGTILVLAGGASVLFAAGISLGWFAAGGTLVAGAMWFIITQTPYMTARINLWLDPWAQRQGDGFQTVQSLLAIGSGQLTGQGYLNGTQTQASYSAALPARQTDFIFSVCGEELGMVGCLLLLLVLALIILRCYWVGRNASSPFSAYVSMGIAGMLLAQVFFNVGMCLYILPVMGLTLPFFSYGGSSIITLYTAMGIVSSIRARTLPSWLRDRNQL